MLAVPHPLLLPFASPLSLAAAARPPGHQHRPPPPPTGLCDLPQSSVCSCPDPSPPAPAAARLLPLPLLGLCGMARRLSCADRRWAPAACSAAMSSASTSCAVLRPPAERGTSAYTARSSEVRRAPGGGGAKHR